MRGKAITTFIACETLTRLTGLADGEALELLTDACAEIDSSIRAWYRSRGQELAAARHADRRQRYLDRRLCRDRALCAFTSAAALAGGGLNSWAGWWWADPAAARIIASLAVKDGIEAWHDADS